MWQEREDRLPMLTQGSTFPWRNMEAQRNCACLEREKGALDTIWTRSTIIPIIMLISDEESDVWLFDQDFMAHQRGS